MTDVALTVHCHAASSPTFTPSAFCLVSRTVTALFWRSATSSRGSHALLRLGFDSRNAASLTIHHSIRTSVSQSVSHCPLLGLTPLCKTAFSLRREQTPRLVLPPPSPVPSPFHQSPYFLDSVPSYFTITYQLVSNRGNEAASWLVTER